MADETLVWDPFDQDNDGVFWDPEIGVDNSPSAEAARDKAAAQKKHAQSVQKHKEEQTKKENLARQAARNAEKAPATAVSTVESAASGATTALSSIGETVSNAMSSDYMPLILGATAAAALGAIALFTKR